MINERVEWNGYPRITYWSKNAVIAATLVGQSI